MTLLTTTTAYTPPHITTAFPSIKPQTPVSLLILGAGWTSAFLIPLLKESRISYAATTRTGHDDTFPFTFDPDSENPDPYTQLPAAKTVLITFPLKGTGQSKLLTSLYAQTHPTKGNDGSTSTGSARFIQLGSTGIFNAPGWSDDNSPYDTCNARAVAEDELLAVLGKRACVLNLAGLYGGERDPRGWVGRVAGTKEEVKGKGAVHFVHGRDVGRAVVGVCVMEGWGGNGGLGGKRWIVTDLRVYDWWDLIMGWGREEYRMWVGELMREEGVRALPRGVEAMGRVLDGRAFWRAVGGAPAEGRVG